MSLDNAEYMDQTVNNAEHNTSKTCSCGGTKEEDCCHGSGKYKQIEIPSFNSASRD